MSRMANMKFSIITICFNSEDCIRKTIESVLNQTCSDYEYFIIDGASSDKTVSIAEEYIAGFKEKGIPYHISSEPDKGIYDAMNKGIRKASGTIVGIINSGDWYERDALETVNQEYDDHPFDMFYADINIYKTDGNCIIKRSKNGLIVTSRNWNHPTTFVTRSTYEDLGLFKCEGIHDDFEFFLRVKKSGKNIVIRNKVLANFVLGGASNKKDLHSCFMRMKDRYRAYRVNGYSRAYLLECFAMEVIKGVLC